MTRDELLRHTLKVFESLADPERAAGVRRFFRETVETYGIRQAQFAPLEGEVYRELKNWPAAARNRFCTALWKTGKLEPGVLVCHVYRRFHRSCGRSEFALFESWIDRYVTNWAHTDGVSTWLLAASIHNEPELIDRLTPWTGAKNRWKRRSAAVSLLQEAKQGRHTEEIFKIAALLASDPDEMVQKGVGWLLKETYPKRPEETVQFVVRHTAELSRLSIRYAAEKMILGDRRRVMPSIQKIGPGAMGIAPRLTRRSDSNA